MSSKASTTIGFERRFNHALTGRTTSSWRRPPGPQPPRPPNMEADRRAEPRPVPRRAADRWSSTSCSTTRSSSTSATRTRLPQGTGRGRSTSRWRARHSARSPRSSCQSGRSSSTPPTKPRHAWRHSARGGRRLRPAGWREAAAPSSVEPVTIDELERRLAADEIKLLDVREADERDAGFIPGSCHLPYRNARQAAENGLCGERPIVTICESGAARGDRGERAARRGPRRAARARRRHPRVAGARRRDDDVPPLRELVASRR